MMPTRAAVAIAVASASAFLVAASCGSPDVVKRGQFRGAPIIVISIDTLRSDHLPAYGYTKVATPAIDALARDGVLFERTYANVPLTLPSHTSILTGLLPLEHGVRNNVGFQFDVAKHPPISLALRAAGYKSAAFVSSYVLRGNTGLAAAFDDFDDAIGARTGVAVGRLQRSGTITLDVATKWIDRNGDAPFFLLFHLFEPHGPYEPPEPFRSTYSIPYDAEIATADDIVGKLFVHLKAKGLYDNAVIVLLSDHGEGLGDHGEEEHGVFLYREALQVPLIIKLPRSLRSGQRVASPVSLIDVAPSLAFLAGLELPSARGVNLFDAKALSADRAIYSETLYPRIHLGWSELRSLLVRRHHYIEAPSPELYDIVRDAAERTNIITDQRRVYASLRDQLSRYANPSTAPAAVDAEEAKKLEALGYVGSMKSEGGPLPDPKEHIAELGALQQANRLSAGGRQKEAVQVLHDLLSANARSSDGWAKLGSIFDSMGEYEKAIDAYAEGIRASPSSAGEFALSISDLNMRLHRLDEAKKHAELALERNPAGAHQYLARIALESGDLRGAEREVRQAMVDEVATPRATVTLAQIRARQGRLDEAVRILEQTRAEAIAKHVSVEHLESTLGDLYAKSNSLGNAEQAFRNEIAHFPSNLSAYSSLAVVLVVQRKYDAVDPVMAEMASRNPSRQAYLVAAKTYDVLGDTRTAAQWRARAARAQ